MTEIEKIAYTKSFIDKLANGINPIDNSPIGENDIMNNVRLVRCMFYVSDILRRIIDNGGISTNGKTIEKKVEFALSVEQLQNFQCSEFSIPISEITKRLNELIVDEHMKKITHNMITPWLVKSNILEEYLTADNKKRKRPTSIGNELGITEEKRDGKYGIYTCVIYNKNAQQFIIDNLDTILKDQSNKNNDTYENQWQPWKYDQEELLKELLKNKTNMKEMSDILQRSETAIKAHIQKLGLQ